MKDAFNKFCRPVGEHPMLFAFILLCCIVSPAASMIIGRMHLLTCLLHDLMQGVAWAYAVCLLVTVCRNRFLKNAVVALCSSVFALGVVIELGTWALLGCPYGTEHLLLILNTNPSEANGFLTHFLLLKSVSVFALYILAFVAAWLVCGRVLRRLTPGRALRILAGVLLGVSLGCGIFLISLYFMATDLDSSPYSILSHNAKVGWVEYFSDPVTKNVMLCREVSDMDEGVDEWLAFQNTVWNEQNDLVVNDSLTYNIGVIFGESMIKKLYELNDTNLRYLPNLRAEADSGHIVEFSDMLSTDRYTIASLRNASMLSDIREADFSKGVFFPMLAAKAGWNVCLYSNQMSGKYADAYFSRLFFSDLNSSRTFRQSCDKNFDNDNEWYSYIKEKYYPAESRSRRLSIYNFLGLHFPWSNNFVAPGRFSSDDFPTEWPADKRLEMAEYASAMWNNDSILGEIFRHYNDDGPAVVVCFSDHGEILRSEMPGASRANAMFDSPEWVRACYEIPMFVWMNSQFIERNPVLADAIREAAGRPGTTDNIGHAILHLCGVGGRYYREELDIFSLGYVVRPRINQDGHNLEALRRR